MTPQEYRELLAICDQKFKEYEAEGCQTYFNKKDHLWTLYEYETGTFKIPSDAKEGMIYGAPAVCVAFAMKNFLYSIPDAFCCAENMVLMATALGISSCIIARGEETFDNEIGVALLREWDIPENYIARCFVLLDCCEGEYPKEKPRKANRSKIIEEW